MALADMSNLMRDDAHYFVQLLALSNKPTLMPISPDGTAKALICLSLIITSPMGALGPATALICHNLFKRLLQPRVFISAALPLICQSAHSPTWRFCSVSMSACPLSIAANWLLTLVGSALAIMTGLKAGTL